MRHDRLFDRRCRHDGVRRVARRRAEFCRGGGFGLWNRVIDIGSHELGFTIIHEILFFPRGLVGCTCALTAVRRLARPLSA